MYSESIGNKTWTAPDEMATENEVSEFLEALVHLVKPVVLVETGCYLGYSTDAMAQSMASGWRDGDGSGRVFHTCDTNINRIIGVRNTINPDFRFMSWNTMTGVQMISEIVDTPIDFAFLDSGGNRLDEAQALLPKLSPGAYVVIHDSRRPTEQAAILYLQEHAKTETLTFDTPRGLAVLRVWA